MPSYPSRESELVTWTNNFASKLSATPAAFGVSIAAAAAYQTASDDWVASYDVANDDLTRSPANIASKNALKQVMLDQASDLIQIINGTATVSDAQKISLGVHIPKPRSPIQAPEQAPGLEVVKTEGRRVTVRVYDVTNPTRRAKPYGVVSVAVFSHIGGDVAPTDPGVFHWEGTSARMTFPIDFPSAEFGTKVWLTVTFQTARGLTSPASIPVLATIGVAGPELLDEVG